jgi:ribosome-binding factor A
MKRKKPSARTILLSADEVGPGDGIDPRLEPRGEPRRVENRKALQLCGQVAQTLQAVLDGCGDDVLRGLLVESVEPAPHSGRMLVRLRRGAAAAPVTAEEVLGRLQTAQGMLRSEVAAAIHRRKAPELSYALLDSDPA